MNLRIGQGFDVHAFGPGEHIMLGGVRIAYNRGFVAHSDGDVLLHALTDAILGAAALGDIGQWFPDTDSQYKDADSAALLAAVWQHLCEEGWGLVNADITVLAERPKLGPYQAEIRARIAQILDVTEAQIGLKATTTEALGFVGRQEGVACQAVVLLDRDSSPNH